MKNDHLTTPDPFETQLRSNLHRLADHAPTTVDLNTATAGDAYVASNDAMAARDRRRRIASIGAIAAVLVGGAGLTIGGLQSASDPGGAKSPDEAVQEFAKALSNADLLGMADMTVPEEAQALRVAATDAVSQAKRLDLLDEAFQLDHVAGFKLQIDGLTLADTPIGDGLVVVKTTGGTVKDEFDPAALQLSDQTRELAPNSEVTADSTDLADDPISFVVQQRGDRWYISAGMSIAESARPESDQPMPADLGIVPEGSASPEAAASAFYGRLANLDLTGASGLLAPGEGDVFRRYAGLWMPGAEEGIASMKADGTEFKITTPIEYERVADSSGRVVLKPVRYGLDVTTPTYEYTTEDTWNSSWATLVSTDKGEYVLPPGTPLPASLDDPIFATAQFVGYDDSEALDKLYSDVSEYNFAYVPLDDKAIENGMVSQIQGDVNGVETTHIEVADGCATTTLPTSAGTPDAQGGLYEESNYWLSFLGAGFENGEKLDDHTFRICAGSSEQTSGLESFWFFGMDESSPLQIPSIVATENGGQWFVSPIGTISELVIGPLRAAPDGASLVDIPVAAMMAGVPYRASFNMMLGFGDMTGDEGQPPECEAVTEKNAEGKTVLVADPDLKLYRTCVDALYGSSDSGSGSFTTESSSTETYSIDASDTSSGWFTYGVPPTTVPEDGAVVESATASQTSGG